MGRDHRPRRAAANVQRSRWLKSVGWGAPERDDFPADHLPSSSVFWPGMVAEKRVLCQISSLQRGKIIRHPAAHGCKEHGHGAGCRVAEADADDLDQLEIERGREGRVEQDQQADPEQMGGAVSPPLPCCYPGAVRTRLRKLRKYSALVLGFSLGAQRNIHQFLLILCPKGFFGSGCGGRPGAEQ